MVQNYLVCRADFPHQCIWGDPSREPIPAGKELAVFLQVSLQSHTTRMSEVWNEHDSNWCFNCDWGRDTINASVTIHDESRWLIMFNIVSWVPSFLWPRRYEASLHAVCEQIDKILRTDRRFADLIWFDPPEYDAFERPKNH